MFETIVSGEDLTVGKPNPEGYLKACKNLNLKPEECLVFEDSPNGIVSALSAGCSVIIMLDKIVPSADIQSKCLFTAKSFNEALNFLKENNILKI